MYLEQDVDASGQSVYDGSVYGVPQSRTDDVGVLTNLQLPASERLSLTFGGRVDYCSTWLNPDDPIITLSGGDYEAGFDTPNYTLGMAYAMAKLKLNDHDTLSLGSGFAMRAPDPAELYSFEPFVPICRFGNSFTDGLSSLQPEKNWQFDLGVSSQRGRVRYGARGFYATIWDYIESIPNYISAPNDSTHYLGRNFEGFSPDLRGDLGLPSENGDTCQAGYKSYNIPLATMAGGDLFGEIEIRKGLSVFGCMSYVHGENIHPHARRARPVRKQHRRSQRRRRASAGHVPVQRANQPPHFRSGARQVGHRIHLSPGEQPARGGHQPRGIALARVRRLRPRRLLPRTKEPPRLALAWRTC